MLLAMALSQPFLLSTSIESHKINKLDLKIASAIVPSECVFILKLLIAAEATNSHRVLLPLRSINVVFQFSILSPLVMSG